MNYKPILFSTPMVKAIMEFTKTQTRRTIKGKNPEMIALLINLYSGVDVERCKEELIRSHALVRKDDVLWVRETFTTDERGGEGYYYKSDFKDSSVWDGYWKPSIFMPKNACRNFLKVTKVRIERLHDISEEEAKAEGVLRYNKSTIYGYHDYLDKDAFKLTAKESFFSLWESINGKASLDQNPFVFVYDFERIEKPKNFI